MRKDVFGLSAAAVFGLCLPAAAGEPGGGPDRLRFVKVWETPEQQTVGAVTVGDPDGDDAADILFPAGFGINAFIRLFENTGDNTYVKVWSAEVDQPGAAGAVSFGDLDEDGQAEVLAAPTSSGEGQVEIFENVENNTYKAQPPWQLSITPVGFTCSAPAAMLSVGDTNANGRRDVVVLRDGGSDCGGLIDILEDGRVIFSDDGPAVFGTWFSNGAVGDFDGDDHPDIIAGHGGSTTFFLDWYEFNGEEYEHRVIEAEGSSGVPSSVAVADIDQDGEGELIAAGVLDGAARMFIFESPADNEADHVQTVTYDNVTRTALDIAVGDIAGDSAPEIVISQASFVDLPAKIFVLWRDGEGEYQTLSVVGPELEESMYNFRRIALADADEDGLSEIVVAAVDSGFVLEEEGPCPADLTGDGVVDGSDLGELLSAWAGAGGEPPDLNSSGAVNGADLGLLLGAWGPCEP